MRLARTVDKGIARHDRSVPRFIARGALAGDDVVEFPLRAVRMVGVGDLPGLEPHDLDRKWMARPRLRSLRIPAERFRKVLARAAILSFGRIPAYSSSSFELIFFIVAVKRGRFGGLGRAIARRSVGHERGEQVPRHLGDALHRFLESRLLACDGWAKPLNLRTYCREEARISSAVAGG